MTHTVQIHLSAVLKSLQLVMEAKQKLYNATTNAAFVDRNLMTGYLALSPEVIECQRLVNEMTDDLMLKTTALCNELATELTGNRP